MTDAPVPDPRARWRWMLWIGAIVAACGMLVTIVAPFAAMVITMREFDAKDAPRPQDLPSPQGLFFSWVLRGLVVVLAGVAVFLYGMLKIRRINDAARIEETWSG